MAADSRRDQTQLVDDDLDNISPPGKEDSKGRGIPPNVSSDGRNTKIVKEKGGKGWIIVLLIFLLLIGGLVAVIWFNVFDIRDKYLSGFLSKIPIVNNLLPTEEVEKPEYSNEELLAEIELLKKDVEDRDKRIKELEDSVDNYIRELEPLQNMEEQQIQFRLDKEAFDSAVALGDTRQYQQWYESIDPDRAEVLYKEAVTINNRSREVRDYISKVSGMDATNIAKAMETFIDTDMELIVLILQAMSQEIASEVLDAMTAVNSGSVIRQMQPDGL